MTPRRRREQPFAPRWFDPPDDGHKLRGDDLAWIVPLFIIIAAAVAAVTVVTIGSAL